MHAWTACVKPEGAVCGLRPFLANQEKVRARASARARELTESVRLEAVQLIVRAA